MIYSGGGNRLSSSSSAFTLAEVLVTLGIIGVVSAMTVPSLMQNYQRQSYVTQLHKVYNELSQALVRYQNDKNAVNLTEAGLISPNVFSDFVKSYFKIIQDCGEEQTPCFAPAYKNIAGVNSRFTCDTSCVILANGSSIGVYSGTIPVNGIAQIVVDINGQKGPNIFGRDAFTMFLYKDGTLDDLSTDGVVPMTKEQREARYATYCINNAAWDGCFGKILNDNWQMTY